MTASRTVFSVAEDYFAAARQELHAAFPDARVERLGPDTGCLHAAGLGIAEVARACNRGDIIFVRHLLREVARLPLHDVLGQPAHLAGAALAVLAGAAVVSDLAAQLWTSGAARLDERPSELWNLVADRLRQAGYTIARAKQTQVLSICITPEGAVLGLNHRADALADWPGGRVALARRPEQISRAELKLDELLQVFDLALPAGGLALDLGASPGGWTRVMRQRGLSVWAVDPAGLDPRLAGDAAIHHVKTTAGAFLAATDLRFDLVVNDMRMDPILSAEVMVAASERLNPHGLAIMTLKLSPHRPLPTVQHAFSVLRRSYDVLHARQLYHNRNEITVVARRRQHRSTSLGSRSSATSTRTSSGPTSAAASASSTSMARPASGFLNPRASAQSGEERNVGVAGPDRPWSGSVQPNRAR